MTLNVLFLGLFLLGPSSSGQGDRPPIQVQVSQSVLREEATRFATAWSGKDTGGLARVLSSGGIRLHLPGEDHLILPPRQAEAALGAFLERYEGGEAVVNRVSPSGAGADRGFAEIRWRTGSPRVSEPVDFTVFVGYAFRNGGWHVTEIRVLF